jgi:hypothetical protein
VDGGATRCTNGYPERPALRVNAWHRCRPDCRDEAAGGTPRGAARGEGAPLQDALSEGPQGREVAHAGPPCTEAGQLAAGAAAGATHHHVVLALHTQTQKSVGL